MQIKLNFSNKKNKPLKVYFFYYCFSNNGGGVNCIKEL